QPTDVVAGETISPAVTLRLKDDFGNNVPGSTVTMNASSGPLVGTTTRITDANGVATFNNLSIANSGSKTLAATSGALTTGSDVFVVSPAAANKLAISVQPSTVNTAGVAFAEQPVIRIEDRFGNLVASDNATVVTATRGAGAGQLQGATVLTAANSVVTFTDLSHNVATNITLLFSSGTLSNTASVVITISPAAVAQLAFSRQPANAEAAKPFGVQPVVRSQD